MKKIAVCIPTYNESENIVNITTSIDRSLKKYKDKYECIIINCDNNSQDNTNEIFNNIDTVIKKDSLISPKAGKGNNILNFLKYCKKNNIDYAMTIDADLKSFDSSWLDKMIYLLEKNNDFIIPNYYRPHYEGNTTNQFAVPILYNLYGYFIRQPIGGDYAFNKKYINTILKYKFTQNILDYGIDIFMSVTAISNNLKVYQVDYGVKVHSDSYSKIKKIFRSVVYGLCEVYKQYPVNNERSNIDYNIKIHNDGEFMHRKYFDECYKELINMYNLNYDSYEIIKNKWINCLKEFIKKVPDIDDDFMKNLEDVFMLRNISFWDKHNNDDRWEAEIIDVTKKVGE